MAALALTAPTAHARLPALRWKRDGAWHDISFPELGDRVRAIARGLIALGVEPGDRVAIISETRPEWTCADLGALAIGATIVPIYPTSPAGDCAYVLDHSGARVVFCDTADQAAKVLPLAGAPRALEHVVTFEPTGAAAATIDLDELGRLGAPIDPGLVNERALAVQPGDLCTLMYTSGTTGTPKGCMLTHRNLRANLDMIEAIVPEGARPVLFAFLPLAHSLTRMLQMYAIDVGGTLAYWDGTRETMLKDVAEVRPTQLPSVPRMYEKVHTAIESGLVEASPLRRWMFHAGVATGHAARERERSGRRLGPLLRVRLALADRLVLSKVRRAFGDRLEVASTGAAPMDTEVLELFHACGIPLMEGYGLTECTAVATINTPSALRIGTVGRPLPGSELRIAGDGEVLIRGPHLFQGYYRDPAATAGALKGGWLRSGDLGELDADGYLTIVGRTKDIVITSSGKNIAPSKIEDALRRSRWISQAAVYGDGRPYLVALITLDPDEAPVPAGRGDVRAEIQRVVDEVNRGLSRIEQVKRFAVLDRDLTEEDGELTPTLKLKRSVIYSRYAAEIDELYHQVGASSQFPQLAEEELVSRPLR
jgi:long-chain acyl-CoA synthetase